MKIKFSLALAITVLLAASMTFTAWAESAKMKMTTPVPPGIATPDRIKTRIGTLNLFDGVPDEKTAQKVYDNLDFPARRTGLFERHPYRIDGWYA